jgi:hypothetical protein
VALYNNCERGSSESKRVVASRSVLIVNAICFFFFLMQRQNESEPRKEKADFLLQSGLVIARRETCPVIVRTVLYGDQSHKVETKLCHKQKEF